MKTQRDMLERIDAVLRNPNLKETSKVFLISIKEWYENKGTLSERQNESFLKIEYRCSDEYIQKKRLWVEGYDEDKRGIAKICASYYLSAGYFTDLARRVLSEPDFIPEERQWRAMCCNKYATRVIESSRAEPKYPVGSVVQLRMGHGYAGLANRTAVVIETDSSPVTRAAKGTKKYLILPVGHSKPMEVEERHIKKSRHK